MPFQVSEAEAQALKTPGTSNEARVLYLLELRPCMDFTTGLVGIRRRISLQQLREGTEVRRRSGSTKADFTPSIEDVRWMLGELERLGLLERQPKARRTDPMVFRLPLAVVGERGYSAQKEEPQRNPKGATPNKNAASARPAEQANPKGTPKEEPHTSDLSGLSSYVSTPLRSVETPELKSSAGVEKRPQAARRSAAPAPTAQTWTAYCGAYLRRYGVEPVRNAKVNGQLSNLVQRLGAAEAPLVAAAYVASNRQLYVGAKHTVDLLIRDAEGLRTEWATGRTVTETQARQVDRRQSNYNAFAGLIAEAEEREKTDGC